ncbi:hypothetical protein BC832DRAFT_12961 [Gaertneriomyces semiglobifer]|nr:hypothetical protein BC832DRAFT_12961 [Gaertneriomyces semiglobifer]
MAAGYDIGPATDETFAILNVIRENLATSTKAIRIARDSNERTNDLLIWSHLFKLIDDGDPALLVRYGETKVESREIQSNKTQLADWLMASVEVIYVYSTDQLMQCTNLTDLAYQGICARTRACCRREPGRYEAPCRPLRRPSGELKLRVTASYVCTEPPTHKSAQGALGGPLLVTFSDLVL